MIYRLNRRLLGLFGAAVAVEFMAFNSLLVWLYLVAAMILAAILMGLLGPYLSLRQSGLSLVAWHREGEFQPAIPTDSGRLFASDRVVLQFHGQLPVDRIASASMELSGGKSLEVEDIRVTAQGVELTTARVKRGTFQMVGVHLVSSWPTAVATASIRIPIQLSLVACPQYQLLKSRAGTTSSETLHTIAQRGFGEEFLGLREYQTGDTMRRIHWRTTARAGRLMVKETARQSDTSVEISCVLEEGASEKCCDLATSTAATLIAQAAWGSLRFVLYIGGGKATSSWPIALAGLAQATPRAKSSVQATVRARGEVVEISFRGNQLEVSDSTPLSAVQELLK